LLNHRHDWLSQILGRWIVFERNVDAFKVAYLAVVAATLAWRRDRQSLRRYFVGRRVSPREDAQGMVLLLLATGIVVALIEIYSPTLVISFKTGTFIDTVVWAAVNEELIFRGIFLGILLEQKRLPPWSAVLLSALLFAGHHSIANVARFVNLTLLGLLLGVAYHRFRSVLFCVVIHATWNLSSFCPAIHPSAPGQPDSYLAAIRWNVLVPLAVAMGLVHYGRTLWKSISREN
jgi:membrane protease YdiL (CAAX protease family)